MATTAPFAPFAIAKDMSYVPNLVNRRTMIHDMVANSPSEYKNPQRVHQEAMRALERKNPWNRSFLEGRLREKQRRNLHLLKMIRDEPKSMKALRAFRHENRQALFTF